MFARWPLRVKLMIGLGLLLAVVVSLAGSGLYATYSFRSLVKVLSARAIELPLAAELSQHVGDLRNTVGALRGFRTAVCFSMGEGRVPLQTRMARDQFYVQLHEVEETLDAYRQRLERQLQSGSEMADNQKEWETLHCIEAGLADVHEALLSPDWMLDEVKVDRLDAELEQLQVLAAVLPSHLHQTLGNFAADVRGQYRLLIYGTWAITLGAALSFLVFVNLFYRWILLPLGMLIRGSRRVAAGEFSYRIHLDSQDEMAELADAMNGMTTRFQDIRDGLDHQVQERTKQVVRSEQLASVGFLAAGVAHEINNPLASIALCAESLESRTRDLLDPANPDHAVIGQYLQMIQSEAFRCKEITEKLLDFSRIGETRRQDTDLNELVQAVIDMLRHLGKYQRKHLLFEPAAAVVAAVNAREIKQVILNLLCNALDCVDDEGTVQVRVQVRDGVAELVVEDNGCGMPPEVLEHVFEPFFTRRKAGQGTGLGLSISYRIIADHGGHIEAHSDGPGRGATFRVRLPLVVRSKEMSYQHQAA